GPSARALLSRLTDAALDTASFPFLGACRIEVAGVACVALRVSFTGDLGWELHCAEPDQPRLYKALLEAGREQGAGPVGSRALMSLRLEKGYGAWGREYSPECWPQEVGLDRLVRRDKPFLNRAAAEAAMARPARESLAMLEIDAEAADASNADASGGEPVFLDGCGVGRVTSGGYGYAVGKSLALGFLRDVPAGARVEVMILGRPHGATVLAAPPFDPEGARLRA
ncbi:MAG: glycine cleavage T C-terminal barrel domain-containing protein, partial [Paracoccaceae bacterium]